LVCLSLLLLVSLAGPLHKDDSHDGAACLICHVTQRASVASIAADAGKLYLSAERQVLCVFSASVRTNAPDTVCTPRAPPSISFRSKFGFFGPY
jgi:hypothetical protein